MSELSSQKHSFVKEEDGNNSNSEQNPRIKKKYSVITQEVREKFIKRVISREVTIKEAAREFGIKFSTSKAILQTFKREGRIGKKKTRQRRPSHNDIDNNGGSHHSPKQQPQSAYKQSKSQQDDIIKIAPQSLHQSNSQQQASMLQHSSYRQGPFSQTGQELNDPTMLDNDLRSTIYEIQATIQEGYSPYDNPHIKTDMMGGGGSDKPLHIPQHTMQQQIYPNLYQAPYMYPPQTYQYPPPPQPYMYGAPQHYQPMYPMHTQKMARMVYYPNPYVQGPIAQSQPLENQAPTYMQIKDQLKGLTVEQLRNNSNIYAQRDIEREPEFNYQNYYQP